MSQEYTEDKDVSLQPLSNRRRLLEASLIIVALFAIYLMVSLFSFNPSDPSWSQTAWHEPIHNSGGTLGAWLADTLFFIFGIMAYAIPPVILGLCWFAVRRHENRQYIDYFAVGLRLIGVFALIVTTCGLAAVNADDIWYFASGGVIGSLVSNAITPHFSGAGRTLTLLCLWAAGFTLYTGWSWLTIAEKTGAFVMRILNFFSNLARGQQHQHQHQHEKDKAINFSPSTTESDEADEYDVLLAKPEKSVTDSDKTEDDIQPDTGPGQTAGQTQANQTDPLFSQRADDAVTPASPPLTKVAESPGMETSSDRPPLYRFELPETAVAEPKVSPPQRPSTDLPVVPLAGDNPLSVQPRIEAVQAAASGAAILASAAQTFTGVADNASVKQGTGPELPRPNPVKVPTRRELASWGIKLPSQRMAEEKARQEEQLRQQQEQEVQSSALFSPSPATDQPGALQSSIVPPEDADTLDDQRLAQQFAQLQQQRYEEAQQEQEAASASAEWPEDNLPVTVDHDQHPANPGSISQQSVSLYQTPEPQPAEEEMAPPAVDSLFHPFLVRHEQPVARPSTPLPVLDLLTSPPEEEEPVDEFALEQTARLVEARLADYRVKADVVGVSPGPVITRYELDLAPGVKAARISNLSRDLARSLSAVAVRVVEVIPGKPYVGLELPNKKRETVYLREVLDCPEFRDNPSPLAIVLGKDIAGEPVVADLSKMPHLLVAGTTGSGKSVGVNAMILSILYKATPDEVRFIMIDPKMLELSVYEGIPHLLTEVVTDMKDAANALRWSVAEMERRYKLMSALGVRNLAGYNEKIEQAAAMGRPIPDPFWKPGDSMEVTPPVLEKLPYIVVMVDEFADLMMAVGKKVEELIARLAQKARAAGIHLVLATQRPSVDVITGLIKANIPTRIAFTVSSKIDSRTILDQGGAESLLGMGDMLYMPPSSSIPVRVHGAFVRDQEVHAVVQDWKARGRPQYIDNITAGDEGEGSGSGGASDEELDPLFDQAVAFVVEKRKASISGVQRQFRIGYNRAARIIEQMEAQGIVSVPAHNGNREVLAPPPHEM